MVNERLADDGLPPAITTDIICGFPTETKEDFEKTVQIAEQVGYLHMHVFPYSVRTGTAAARWKQLPPEIVRNRVQTLLNLDSALSLAFRSQLIGRRVTIMIEQLAEKEGCMRGRCGHYADITIQTDAEQGELIEAQVTQADDRGTYAMSTINVLH